MSIFDNLRDSFKKWLKLDEQIHSLDKTGMNALTIYDEYALYDAWAISDSKILEATYKKLPESFKNSFWKAVPEDINPLPKKTTGIASIILSSIINIISENYEGITFNEREDKLDQIWTKMEIDNNFYKVIIKAVRDVLVYGEGAFKLFYLPEISELPIITFVGAKKCKIEYAYNRVKYVEFYDNIYHDDRGDEYILHEIYSKGKIEYKLFKDGKEVPIASIPETQALQDIEFADKDFMAAVPYHIYDSDKHEGHGESIYANGKTDLFDMLDETISQFNLTVRLSSPKLYANESMFQRDTQGNRIINSTIFNPLYVKHSANVMENDENIQVIQNAINSDSYGQTVSQLITLICAGLLSPSTLAIQIQNKTIYNSDSGEAQREKEKQTLYTINKIKSTMFNIIPDVIIAALKFYGILTNQVVEVDKTEITVEMSEYANPSFEAQIQVLKTACPELTIMTPEEIISEKYGYTITDEEKEELVRALYIINYGVENLEQLLHKDDKLLEDQEIEPEETQDEEETEETKEEIVVEEE